MGGANGSGQFAASFVLTPARVLPILPQNDAARRKLGSGQRYLVPGPLRADRDQRPPDTSPGAFFIEMIPGGAAPGAAVPTAPHTQRPRAADRTARRATVKDGPGPL